MEPEKYVKAMRGIHNSCEIKQQVETKIKEGNKLEFWWKVKNLLNK